MTEIGTLNIMKARVVLPANKIICRDSSNNKGNHDQGSHESNQRETRQHPDHGTVIPDPFEYDIDFDQQFDYSISCS